MKNRELVQARRDTETTAIPVRGPIDDAVDWIKDQIHGDERCTGVMESLSNARFGEAARRLDDLFDETGDRIYQQCYDRINNAFRRALMSTPSRQGNHPMLAH